MKLFSSLLVLFLVAVGTLPSDAAAENLPASVSGDLDSALEHFSDRGTRALVARPRSFRSVDPIHLSTRLPNGSPVQLELLTMVRRYWPAYYLSDRGMTSDQSEVTLFRGLATIGHDEVPLAAAIYEHEGRPTLFADFVAPSGDEYYHLNVPLAPGESETTAGLEVVGATELSSYECSSDQLHDLSVSAQTPPLGEARSAREHVLSDHVGIRSLRTLEIATEADFQFFARYGSESNAKIASIINAADTVYQRDLNIDLEIVFQHTVTSSSQPYTATVSGELLNQFVSYTNLNSQLGAADAYHLFSGKDFDGQVIGTAYLNVVCAVPSLSYAVIQDIGPLTYLVYAHELGHNLGGAHDTSGAVTIMAPALSASTTSFSAFSIGQISGYVNTYGSCLSSSDPTGGDGGGGGTTPPSDSPAPTLSLSALYDADTNRFTAQISAAGVDAEDCQASLAMGSDITLADAQTVRWGRDGSNVVSGSAKNKKRISTGESFLFVQARYVCPSLAIDLSSATQSIQVGNATKAKQVVAPSKWIRSTLKAAAKSSRKRANNG